MWFARPPARTPEGGVIQVDDYRSVRKSLMDSMDDLSNSEKKVARSLLAQYPAAD